MTIAQSVQSQIPAIAAANINGFTANQIAVQFKISEKLATKILRETDGLTTRKVGEVKFYEFGEVKTKRNIKIGTEERREKVIAYFKAACYNATKTGMTREDLRTELEAMMTEYDVETAE
jgi:hypothetical protein